MFQFSSTDLASGVDAKNSDDDFDKKSLKPSKVTLLYKYTL